MPDASTPPTPPATSALDTAPAVAPAPQSAPPMGVLASRSDLVKAALAVVFALVGLQLLWEARLLVLTAFLGVLFGLGAAPGVDALERRGLRRGFGAPFVVFGVLALLIAFVAWTAPTLVEQSQELKTRFPEALQKGEAWLATHQPRLLDLISGGASGTTAGAAVSPDSTAATHGRIADALVGQADKIKSLAMGILTSTLSVFGGLVLVIFLAVYIAAEPDLYKRGLLALAPTTSRRRLEPVLTAVADKLRRWLSTQAIAMLVIGAVTTIVLSIIGVRAAVPLGVIAGILEFIPNIGPTLSAIPAVAMAFVDSPQKALVVMAAYWGIQFLENNLLIPYLMKEQLDLPPALTMMTQVVMAYVFGLMGLFVATPLLAAIFVAVQMLHVEPDASATPPSASAP